MNEIANTKHVAERSNLTLSKAFGFQVLPFIALVSSLWLGVLMVATPDLAEQIANKATRIISVSKFDTDISMPG